MKKVKHYIKEIFIFIVTLSILANVISIYKSQDLPKAPLTMRSVPLIDGTDYTIAQNKPVLLHFWASWCPVCKAEASNINFLSKHFTVLSVAVKSGTDKELQKYLQDHNYTFKVVNDQNGMLSKKFHIAAFPTTFIYDAKQKMAFSEVGYTSTFGLWLRMWWAGL
jgi:thiol-disulfide isomerase/thioredoxin